MQKIIIYGMQRSGTNYLEAMVRRRFRVRFVNDPSNRSSLLLKHARLYDNKSLIPEPKYRNDHHVPHLLDLEKQTGQRPALYLVISKDPYSWLISYRNWASKCSWPPADHHYLEEYAAFYGKWVEFAAESERVCLVRYDDLLRKPQEVLDGIQERGKLSQRWLSHFLPLEVRKVSQSRDYNTNKRKVYEAGNHLMKLTPQHFDDARRLISAHLMNALGYEYKNPL